MKKKAKQKSTKKESIKKDLHKEHWKNMPEFNQPDAGPVKSVIVNFQSKEDMHKFSKLIGQLITAKTKSVWYPFVPEEVAINKRWSK